MYFCLILYHYTINKDYTWYYICCAWFLDIIISTCYKCDCKNYKRFCFCKENAISYSECYCFLNQARAGFGRRAPGFLKLFLCGRLYVCVFVCPPPRLLITSGVIWTPYDWLNKFYSCYMATVVVIINGRGLGIDTRRRC